jgi:hypothetical protein
MLREAGRGLEPKERPAGLLLGRAPPARGLPLLVVKARGRPPSLLNGRLEPGREELGRSEYGLGVLGRPELGRAA